VAAEELKFWHQKKYFKMNGKKSLTEWPGEVDNLAPGQKLVSGWGQIQLTRTGRQGAVVC
jgi:hypothetical protein